jgi:hypothetical protein
MSTTVASTRPAIRASLEVPQAITAPRRRRFGCTTRGTAADGGPATTALLRPRGRSLASASSCGRLRVRRVQTAVLPETESLQTAKFAEVWVTSKRPATGRVVRSDRNAVYKQGPIRGSWYGSIMSITPAHPDRGQHLPCYANSSIGSLHAGRSSGILLSLGKAGIRMPAFPTPELDELGERAYLGRGLPDCREDANAARRSAARGRPAKTSFRNPPGIRTPRRTRPATRGRQEPALGGRSAPALSPQQQRAQDCRS